MKRRTSLPIADSAKAARERRRRFLKTVATAGAVGAASTVVGKVGTANASCYAKRVAVAEISDLNEGAIVEFRYPTEEDEAFITRLPGEAFRGVGAGRGIIAYLRACPHMGCLIEKVHIESAVLGPCGCHRSRFDLARGGQQIVGRATQNLVQVILEVSGGTVYAVGVVGLPFGHALEQ